MTFTWNNNVGGFWQNSTNWAPIGVPDDADDTAVFGFAINGPSTILNASDTTIGGLVFDNSNSYTIENTALGQLTLDGPGAGPALIDVGSGNHTINAAIELGADVNVSINEPSLLTLNATFTTLPAPSINKEGGGDLRFNGFAGLNGGTVFGQKGTISGTGEIGGNLDSVRTTVAPGENNIGTLFVQQNYIQRDEARVELELAGTSPSQHDRLIVFGDAIFDGSLDVDLFSGYSPNVGDEFIVMTFASRAGSFDTVSLPTLVSGRQMEAIFNDSDLRLKVGRHINWVGGSGVKQWTNPNNWQFNFIPDADSVAVISGTGTTQITDDNVNPVLGVQLLNNRRLSIVGNFGPADLQVLGSVELDDTSTLEVLGTLSRLDASTVGTRGQVFIGPNATIAATHKYEQTGGATNLEGTLTAEDINIHRGLLTGNGQIRGNLNVGTTTTLAQLSPSVGVGTLDVVGDLTLGQNSELLVELDGSGPSLVADQLLVNGHVCLGGTLHLSALGSPSIPIEEPIEILIGDSFEPGKLFDEITGLVTNDGSLIVSFLTGGGGSFMTVSLHSSQMLGDMNGDNTVDDMDAEMFAWALRDSDTYYDQFILGGGGADESIADMDSDGDLTFADIPLFLTEVEMSGSSVAAASAAMAAVFSAAVPEPSSLLLLAISLPLVINCRNRPQA